ncbi:MAG: 50S ribosomal protein L18 [Deltaproteobacteria bacterium]|nr:50S ribosomal protein L18 [Deltaproteobacteria bacterium]
MDLKKRKRLVRERKKRKIRGVVSGSSARPRLSVFKSLNNIYVQAIDDEAQVTLAAASTKDKNFGGSSGGNRAAAKEIGRLIAERLQAKAIKSVVFDRNGFVYHGRIRELAEGAREAGLEF